MDNNEYAKTFSELQEKWKCKKPGHQFCYLPKGEHGKHISFPPREWGIWTQQILEKKAVMDYPPRIPELDNTLDKQSKSGKGKHRSHPSNSDSDSSERRDVTLEALKLLGKSLSNYQQPTQRSGRSHSDPYSSPTKCRKGAVTVPVTRLLSRQGYLPKDYNTTVLNDFASWLSDRYPGTEFAKSVELLKKHGVGGDVLGENIVNPRFLRDNCEVRIGDAIRICKDYKEWLTDQVRDETNQSFDYLTDF